MAIKKRYCEHCDGVNSGGYYDDICMIQELAEYQQFLFDNSTRTARGDYGCNVPAKIWREANERYGDFDCGFAICDALRAKRDEE